MQSAILVIMMFLGVDPTNGYPNFTLAGREDNVTWDECFTKANDSNKQVTIMTPGTVIVLCIPDQTVNTQEGV